MTIENGEVTSEQVSLPERYERSTLASMLPGEETYTTPWTLWFDTEGLGWINGEVALYGEPGKTAEMWVARLEDGFAVDICDAELRWLKQSSPPGFGMSENSIPVVALITNVEERAIIDNHLERLKSGFEG